MNLNEPILDLSDMPLDGDVTVGTALMEILLNCGKDLTGGQKFTIFELAVRVERSNEEIAFSDSEKELLKTVIGMVGTPLIVGRLWTALDA